MTRPEQRSITAGDLALTRDDKVVRVLTIHVEDGVAFAWIAYTDPADEADRLERSPGGYISPGVWEHCLNDRTTFSTHYPRDEHGEYLRAWDGGIVQEFIEGHEQGLRPLPPVEDAPTAAAADAVIGAERNGASAMDRLEAALASGVPIADLLAAQAIRHGRAFA